MKCCICGKEIKGFGNNPWGALNKKGEEIKWKPEEECCDECNGKYVVPGRIAKLYKGDPKAVLKIMPNNLVDKE